MTSQHKLHMCHTYQLLGGQNKLTSVYTTVLGDRLANFHLIYSLQFYTSLSQCKSDIISGLNMLTHCAELITCLKEIRTENQIVSMSIYYPSSDLQKLSIQPG